ncbi:MAG: ribulose-phosphate 3-epimerase [Myxococcota bacterium]|nr:ribulose-phosphate 3-epimerase [Myxococcota bacterium]MEC8423723.1 ribulose-phosphate 3-epimerase [Myxococcota bacterium]
MALVAPSILSADFGRLAEELDSVSAAEWVHVDVMDGRFVPNITIGPLVVKAVRAATEKVVDCHLMIVEPDRYVPDFADAGADVITVHAEACPHLDRSIQLIKSLGCKAGVALNPHTPEGVLDYVLDELDLVLVMSVNPGFGGQSLIDRVFPKIERLRGERDRRGLDTIIQVDGGVKTHNAWRFVEAGASCLVSGSGVFKAADRTEAIRALQAAEKPDPGGAGRS